MKIFFVICTILTSLAIVACSGNENSPPLPTDNPAEATHATSKQDPGGTPTFSDSREVSTNSTNTPPSITCALAQNEPRIDCQVIGGSGFTSWSWTSNATSRTSGAKTFVFGIEEQINEIEVSVELCSGSSCEILTSIIDRNQEVAQHEGPGAESSGFLGRNMFELPFSEFPFSCTEFGKVEFTSSFFPSDLIKLVEPMGRMSAESDHVTPTDHLYVHRVFTAGAENVVSPGNGYVVAIERASNDSPLNGADEFGNWLGDTGPMVPDHRITIMHSCNVFTIFIHLGDLAPAIVSATGEMSRGSNWGAGYGNDPIPIKAGEVIGKFGSQSFDWSVHDAETVLEGFVVPEHYEWERYKIHTVDPFPFYTEPARSALLDKVIRKVEPRAGKIDHDVEGTIAGNWFLDGSIDFIGSGQPDLDYTEGHLAIAYGSVDPSQLAITIGANTGIDEDLCNICFGSYGIRGNQPDPRTVDSSAGLVKYELMSREEYEDRYDTDQVGTISLGTFLVEHLGDRTIRIEVIPNKSPDEIEGFSNESSLYRR